VKRYRDDKQAADADNMVTVRQIMPRKAHVS